MRLTKGSLLALFGAGVLSTGAIAGVPAAARFLEASDAVEVSDFITVFAGDYPFRPLHAARLYHGGYAREIVTTGAFIADELCVVGLRISGAELSAIVLQQQGVPARHIHALDEGYSTLEEARAFARFVASKKVTKVIVVTSPYHVRRAKLILGEVLAERGVRVLGSAAPTRAGSLWWRNKAGLIHMNNELLKLGFYELPGSLRQLILGDDVDARPDRKETLECPPV